MGTPFSILTWRISWTEGPSGLQSMGSERVRHDLVTENACAQFSHSVVSDSLRPRGLQHAKLPCPSPTPGAYSNSCPSSWWYPPLISSSVIPFSSHLQSFPASGSFPVSQFFASGDQHTGVSASASIFPMNVQDWFPSRLTGFISLQSKGLSRVFSNTMVQKHQFFNTQPESMSKIKIIAHVTHRTISKW